MKIFIFVPGLGNSLYVHVDTKSKRHHSHEILLWDRDSDSISSLDGKSLTEKTDHFVRRAFQASEGIGCTGGLGYYFVE